MLLATISTFHGMVQYKAPHQRDDQTKLVADAGVLSSSTDPSHNHRLSRATSPRTNYAYFIANSGKMKIIKGNRYIYSRVLRASIRWAQVFVGIILLAVLLVFCFGFLPAEWHTIKLLQSLRTRAAAGSDENAAGGNFLVSTLNIAATTRGVPLCSNVAMSTRGFRSPRDLTSPPTTDKNGQRPSGLRSNQRHPLIVHFIRMVVNGGDEFGDVEPSGLVITSWEMNPIQYASVLAAWKALLEAKQYDLLRDNEQNTARSSTSRGEAGKDDEDQPTIYLHSNIEPSGKYYDLLRNKHKVNIKWNFAERKKSFNNRWIRYLEHEADFHKLNATYTFGGVHADFDVLMINGTRLRQLQQDAECVVAVDVNLRMDDIVSREIRHGHDFLLNSGLLSCAKQSQFLKVWRDSYHCDFRSMDYLYNSGVFPRLLFEQYYPHSSPIKLDAQSGMYFRSELINETSVVPKSEWLGHPGMHFYHIEHLKLNWNFMLRKSMSMFAQAMRYVHFGTTEPQTLPSVDWD